MSKLLMISLLAIVFAGTSYTMSYAENPEAVTGSDFIEPYTEVALPPICDNIGFVWHLTYVGRGTLVGTATLIGCPEYDAFIEFDSVDVAGSACIMGSSHCVSCYYVYGLRDGLEVHGNWISTYGDSGAWHAGPCN